MSERDYKETRDSEEIRNWAEERNVVPTHQDGDDVIFVEEGNGEDELTWDEFEEDFERRDATFRYETEAEVSHYEFVENGSSSGIDSSSQNDDGELLDDHDDHDDHDENMLDDEHDDTERDGTDINADVDTDLGEGDELEKGDSARSEVTETRTVEREIVETATVETEVVDEEVVGEEVIDTELLERELTGCSLDDEGMGEDGRGGYIEADLRERKRFTTEVRERNLIESHVVDADAAEGDSRDSGTSGRDVDTEGNRELIDDETVEREVDEADIDEREHSDVDAELTDSESEYDERIERRMIETEVVEQYHVRAEIESRDLFDEDVVSEEVTDTELLDDGEGVTADAGEGVTADAGDTAAGATAGGDDDFTRSASADDTTDRDDDDLLDDDDDSERGGTENTGVHLSADEVGNDVINADSEKIGVVSEVDEGTVYVDPDPSFTERLLGQSGADEGDAVIREEHIDSIEGDEVRLSREGQEDVEREAN